MIGFGEECIWLIVQYNHIVIATLCGGFHGFRYLLEEFGIDKTETFLRDRYSLETNHDVLLPGFTDILTYAAATEATTADTLSSAPSRDKCLAVELHRVAHLTTAIAEMNAVAARNPRVKDAAYHFILSWPEHEKPHYDKMFDAARHALTALNLDTHQYMLAVHGNTDNWHCHVAVNRVHPTTFKSQHLPYAIRTLHRAARESEIKHGWSHDNGIYVVDIDESGNKTIVKNSEIDIRSRDSYLASASTAERTPNNIAASSTWTDPDSLLNWTRTTVAPKLKSALPTMGSWSELHQFLSQHGLVLKDTGGGGMRLTAYDRATGEVLDIAASKAIRFLKRHDLEGRWGAFQASTVPIKTTEPKSATCTSNFTGFDRFDRFGPHPETAFRRKFTHELHGGNVEGGGDRSDIPLTRDAPDHMEHTEADFDTSPRRVGDANGSLIPSPDNDSPAATPWTAKRTVDTGKTDKSKIARRRFDSFEFSLGERVLWSNFFGHLDRWNIHSERRS